MSTAPAQLLITRALWLNWFKLSNKNDKITFLNNYIISVVHESWLRKKQPWLDQGPIVVPGWFKFDLIVV